MNNENILSCLYDKNISLLTDLCIILGRASSLTKEQRERYIIELELTRLKLRQHQKEIEHIQQKARTNVQRKTNSRKYREEIKRLRALPLDPISFVRWGCWRAP